MAVDVESLYRRFGPMVYRRCHNLLRDADAARDATQDVFVQVLRRQATLDDTAPSSLLWRIATNVCLNRLRTRKRKPEDAPTLLDAIAHADDLEADTGMRQLLVRVFDREPASTRAMAVMLHVDGMTLDEVAEAVGLSVSGVRKRLRALSARVASLPEVL